MSIECFQVFLYTIISFLSLTFKMLFKSICTHRLFSFNYFVVRIKYRKIIQVQNFVAISITSDTFSHIFLVLNAKFLENYIFDRFGLVYLGFFV